LHQDRLNGIVHQQEVLHLHWLACPKGPESIH
jgi:hypothetical protein